MGSAPRSVSFSPAWVAVAIGYGVAATALVLRLGLGDLPRSVELPGALALAAVAAVPPTLALIGLTRRPVLLLAAGVVALTSLPVLSVLGLVTAIAGVVWLASAAPRGVGPLWRAAAITAAVWLLWTMSAAMVFIHLDPRCAQTRVGGTVTVTGGEAAGFYSGWTWNEPSTISGSSAAGLGSDVISETCVSDVVTWLEATAVFVLAAGSVAAGWAAMGSDP